MKIPIQVTSQSDLRVNNNDVKYYNTNELRKIDYFYSPVAVVNDTRKKHGLVKKGIKVY